MRPGRSALPHSSDVGRVVEWRNLTKLWYATEAGRAQFVLITGEPGIGKTRLIEELRAWCDHRGAVTVGARAYPAEGALAYGPVVAWPRAEPLAARRDRLGRAHLVELGRLLPELLPDLSDLTRPDLLPESEQRQRLFDAAARAILAAGGPLLLVADDVHWWDQESLQFLHYLLRVAPDARLLVAATARREELGQRHPVNDLLNGMHVLGRLSEIELGRLSREETALLAEQVVGRRLTRAAAALRGPPPRSGANEPLLRDDCWDRSHPRVLFAGVHRANHSSGGFRERERADGSGGLGATGCCPGAAWGQSVGCWPLVGLLAIRRE